MLRRVVWYKLSVVSVVLTVSIISLVIEAVITSETSVIFYQTTYHLPADGGSKHL
jgi:hypothetical protein